MEMLAFNAQGVLDWHFVAGKGCKLSALFGVELFEY
jgi:hypothetical protein